MTDLATKLRQLADDIDELGEEWAYERWAYERWEYKDSHIWIPCLSTPLLYSSKEATRYRRKPDTVSINGRKVPRGITQPPGVGTSLYAPSPCIFTSKIKKVEYGNTDYHRDLLRRGMLHKTPEAAKEMAEAMLAFGEHDETT